MFTVIPGPLFLPTRSVKLGRLIVNIEKPHENYHEPLPNEAPGFIKSTYTFSNLQQSGNAADFGATLTSLMSANFSKRTKSEVSIAPITGAEYILDNSEEWFDKIVTLEGTRRWIEKAALRANKIYMIVGIQTITDARIIQSSKREHRAKGQIDAPVSLSLAAAGAVVPFAGLVDPEIHGEHNKFESGQSQFLALGEQVCALQYRKLGHKWLSSRTIDTMRLSPTRHWSCMEGDKRTMHNEEGDEDEDLEDIIGVDFEDEDDLGKEWMTDNAGERQIYVHS